MQRCSHRWSCECAKAPVIAYYLYIIMTTDNKEYHDIPPNRAITTIVIFDMILFSGDPP